MRKTIKFPLLISLILSPIGCYYYNQERPEDVLDKLQQNLEKFAISNNISIESEIYAAPEISEGQEEYDLIIVGAGSAGSVLLNRLSNVSQWKILVLEAGSEPDFMTEIPMFSVYQQFTSKNWRFTTEKEDNLALGLKNQKMNWPRGKVLGGTSILNYMVYTRGNKIDYDRWAELGNKGWSYDELLPHFKKIENSHLQKQDEEYRGKDGELSVEDVTYRTKSAEAFVEAAQQLGYKYFDVNGKNLTGVEFAQATTQAGLRCSGEKAFIRPAKRRQNLTVRTGCHVTKVLINGATKTALGVQFVQKGMTYMARATKEVILSAGVINTPHILMLSGIGPRRQLENFGIEVIQDLPVGQKLYDHPLFVGLAFTVNESITYDLEKVRDPKLFLKLHKEGRGPLHNLGGLEALAFLKTNVSADPNPSYPDIELLFFSLHVHSDKGIALKNMIRMSDEIYDAVYRPLEGKPAYGIFLMLLHPKSYGHMELQVKNPFIHPKIYAHYFSDLDSFDMKTLIAGIHEAKRFAAAPALQKYGSKLVETPIPGCKTHQFDSDAYWECAVRHLASTTFHHTTTCKMGPVSDPEAVVDDRLCIYGVKNLRVVDTSVIPIQLTAHTNVPAYMIGQKAAEMIKEDWLS